jgi:phospholipid/cholesterol/gamma-HCH transport system substrate-binding protein
MSADGDSGQQGWRLRRHLYGRLRDLIAVVILIVAGLTTAYVIVSREKVALPSWVPFLGQSFVHYDAEFSSAQAVTPGQGQAVQIAGIRVGQVSSVSLDSGRAVVGLSVDPKYAPLIHPDARLLLRPRTGLNDMVVEVDPGTGHRELKPGSTIPLASTTTNVQPDQILATLDGDTRQYLQLLLAAGAQGIGGQGPRLSADLRRLDPFALYVSQLNGAIARRRAALARVVHDFSLLVGELGQHDAEIARFVGASRRALGSFADQQEAIRSSLRRFPAALATTRRGLESAGSLSRQLRPTLVKLIPQAEALKPALAATTDLFTKTAAPLRDQIRPFTRQVRPTLRTVSKFAQPLATTVGRFGQALGGLNYGLNELAYNPPGASHQSYLFYVPWLNHDLNATYLTQDAGGPLRRGLVLLSCNTASLADGFALARPFLKTLQQATNVPMHEEICG